MVISLYSIKIVSSKIFEIYLEITEIEMTQFITQLLWFPAELRCSIRVTMQFLQTACGILSFQIIALNSFFLF